MLRVTAFRGPHAFKAFIGLVLVALALKLALDVTLFRRSTRHDRTFAGANRTWIVVVSVLVGLIGGIYGIGGGTIIAPFLVAVLGMSIYRVAGAALIATFVTSIVGVATFEPLGTSRIHRPQGPTGAWGCSSGPAASSEATSVRVCRSACRSTGSRPASQRSPVLSASTTFCRLYGSRRPTYPFVQFIDRLAPLGGRHQRS